MRPLSTDDADALYAIHSRPEVMRYLYQEPHTRQDIDEIIAKRIPNTVLEHGGDELSVAVVLKETGRLIGTAVLKWTSAEHQQGEVGYVLHPDQHGNGYATEAAKALVEFGFRDAKLHRITGKHRRPQSRVGAGAGEGRYAQGGASGGERVRQG